MPKKKTVYGTRKRVPDVSLVEELKHEDKTDIKKLATKPMEMRKAEAL